jgi:peptidyl-Asp metalloendopeptidase
MESMILLMETELNIGFINSNISLRGHIVKSYLAAGHNDSTGTFGDNLGWLANATDGRLDEIHALRNTYMADLVSIIVSNGEVCGLGYQPGAFSAVAVGCATGSYTFGKGSRVRGVR